MLEITLSMFIWGTLGMVVMWSKMSALDITFHRCLIGAVVVGLYLYKTKRKIIFDRQLWLILVAGVFAVANWILLFKSFQLASITIGNMSYYLQPVMLLSLGFFLKIEKFSWRKISLILASCVGVLLTIRLSSLHSANMLLGISCALIAAILYSLVTLIMRDVKRDIFVVIFIQLVVGALLLAPFAKLQIPSLQSGLWLLVIGIIHTSLAYYCYYQGIKKVSVSQVAVLSYLDPIVAILSDVIFFNQQLNAVQISGIIITFIAGCVLIRLKQS